MKKFTLAILAAIITISAPRLCAQSRPTQSPSQPRILLEDYTIWDGTVKVDGNLELGDLTVESLPSYKDSLGTPTRAIIDDQERVIVNIGSETAGITTAIEGVGRPVPNIDARVVSLSAGVSTEITAALTDRRFIEIAAHNTEAEFFINFGAPAGADTIRKVHGSIYLELPESVVVHAWSSGGGNFSVIEGGD